MPVTHVKPWGKFRSLLVGICSVSGWIAEDRTLTDIFNSESLMTMNSRSVYLGTTRPIVNSWPQNASSKHELCCKMWQWLSGCPRSPSWSWIQIDHLTVVSQWQTLWSKPKGPRHALTHVQFYSHFVCGQANMEKTPCKTDLRLKLPNKVPAEDFVVVFVATETPRIRRTMGTDQRGARLWGNFHAGILGT